MNKELQNWMPEKTKSLKEIIEENKWDLLKNNLSTRRKAQKILQYVEKDKDLFSNEERNLIDNYACASGDIKLIVDFMDSLVKADNVQERSRIFHDAQQEIELYESYDEAMFNDATYADYVEHLTGQRIQRRNFSEEAEAMYVEKVERLTGQKIQTFTEYISENEAVIENQFSIRKKALELLRNAEKDKDLFSEEERDLIYKSAFFSGDIKQAVGLMDSLLKADSVQKRSKIFHHAQKKIKQLISNAETVERHRVQKTPKITEYLSGKKQSVLGKLRQYKTAVEEKNVGNEHEIKARNNDTRER